MKRQKREDLEKAAHHLIKHSLATFYSDVADELNIDLKQAVKICNSLLKKGLIRPRTKEEAERKPTCGTGN